MDARPRLTVFFAGVLGMPETASIEVRQFCMEPRSCRKSREAMVLLLHFVASRLGHEDMD